MQLESRGCGGSQAKPSPYVDLYRVFVLLARGKSATRLVKGERECVREKKKKKRERREGRR